jgi:methionine synthase I (cobalamin-dependent)
VVKAGVAAGADAILIETMSDTYEAKAAILAAKENSEPAGLYVPLPLTPAASC